jgi:hypothetical protein
MSWPDAFVWGLVIVCGSALTWKFLHLLSELNGP